MEKEVHKNARDLGIPKWREELTQFPRHICMNNIPHKGKFEADTIKNKQDYVVNFANINKVDPVIKFYQSSLSIFSKFEINIKLNNKTKQKR